jgi:hypothetical protein
MGRSTDQLEAVRADDLLPQTVAEFQERFGLQVTAEEIGQSTSVLPYAVDVRLLLCHRRSARTR